MFWKQFNIKVMAEVMHRHFKAGWAVKKQVVYNLSQALIIFVTI